MTAHDEILCPGCGRPQEGGSGELCPACLIRLGLEGADPEKDTIPAVEGLDGRSAPDRIGPYRIDRLLGEGGMGRVYLAHQEHPIRRTVALKLIKQGIDSKETLARFETERRSLELMDHPSIARVLDAGSTTSGRPWFVMEYVDGLPINRFCDESHLTTEQRLRLVIRVCEAVQHAHVKGVIHRDLKPSNVLVTTADDGPLPKVIDFGIAKATGERMLEWTRHTEMGRLIGTPEYMSPEQADTSRRDVDTRTDVYALGVMLYELLVGRTPHDADSIRNAGLEEMLRLIREEELATPSSRLSTLGDDATSVAVERSTDPGRLIRKIRGELDWITMRALEKDRERRYGSPIELSADLERHLNHEPVVAGPPTASYRFRKFVRKHRIGVAMAAIVSLALVAILVLQTVNAARLTRERDRANREAVTANRVVEFLTNLFQEASPIQARGAEATAREIMERGTEAIAAGLEDEPQIQARLMQTIGWIDVEIGLYEEALGQFEQSAALLESSLGADHPEAMRSEFSAGAALVRLGRYEEAEQRLRSVHERQQAVLGNLHLDPWETANYMAQAVHGLGRLEEALEWHMSCLEGYRAVVGESSEITLGATANVGLTLKDLGRLEEAEPYYQRAIDGHRALLGEDHPETMRVQQNLGLLLMTLGRLDEAEQIFRQNLEIRQKVLGSEHPETMGTVNDLATVLQNQGRLAEAEPLRKQVLERSREDLGDDHPSTLRALNNIGSLLMSQDKFEEAEPYMSEVAAGVRKIFGTEHPNALVVFGNLGQLYCKQGKYAKGEAILQEVAITVRNVLPREHVITGFSIRKYGSCLAAAGQYDRAEELLIEAAGILEAAVGPEQPHTMDAFDALADLYERRGNELEAQRWRERLPD